MLDALPLITALAFPLALVSGTSLSTLQFPRWVLEPIHPPAVGLNSPSHSFLSVPPSSEIPESVHAGGLTDYKLAKKNKNKEVNTSVVTVTSAQITGENIVGTWFYRLKGSVTNNTTTPVSQVVVHFEIRTPDTNKLITAGSAVVQPAFLPPGGQGEFSSEPNQSGQIKITLVEWAKPDRSYGSHSQMQMFP